MNSSIVPNAEPVGSLRAFLFILGVLAITPAILGLSLRVCFQEGLIDYVYATKRFPADFGGLSKKDRKDLAKMVFKVVMSRSPSDHMRAAILPGGSAAFSKREIRHIVDVRALLSAIFSVTYSAILLLACSLVYVRDRKTVERTLLYGSGLACGVVGLLILISFTNFLGFFGWFHTLFFEAYTWRFSGSATLVRIYPNYLTFFAAFGVVVCSLFLSLSLFALGVGLRALSIQRVPRLKGDA